MLDDKDLDILDHRYKRLTDCDREMEAAQREHHDLDKRLAVIENAMKVNNWRVNKR